MNDRFISDRGRLPSDIVEITDLLPFEAILLTVDIFFWLCQSLVFGIKSMGLKTILYDGLNCYKIRNCVK